MSKKSRFSALFGVLALACSGFASDALSIGLTPALEGFAPPTGTLPIAVTLRNSGPDARGILHVTGSNGYQMDYPIDLPRDSNKRLVTYPTASYGQLRFSLETDKGAVGKTYEPAPYSAESANTVLLISDNSGEMAFIRGRQPGAGKTRDAYGNEVQPTIQDAYASPDLAPNRPVGYANLAGVMLGQGAERLRDDQVQALKLYALSGGTLIFVGGASSPVLSDARWTELLPLQDLHTVNVPYSPALEQLGNEAPPPLTVTTGTPVTGAIVRKDRSTVMTAERGWGIGKVVYLAFNPLESPLNHWEGRQTAVAKAIRPTDLTQRQAFLRQFSGNTSQVTYTYYGSGPFSTGPAVRMASTSQGDPFSTQLPPTERVFTLLGAYFLVVVPLNFLVLKKLRRGELAWFTAPLISLGFAGAFFASAQDLYSARMSTAVQGVLVGQQGQEEGIFVGTGQIFVPRSGSYDLKLQGVDSLGVLPVNQPYYSYSSSSSDGEFEPIDVGEVKVPHMHADNLAFREIDFRQRVPVGQWFSLEAKRVGPDQMRCTVRNLSRFTLENASVVLGTTEKALGTLGPGETQTKTVKFVPTNGQTVFGTWSMPQVLGRNRGLALIGSLQGFRPGPQIGTQVEGRTSIRLAYLAKEALGPK